MTPYQIRVTILCHGVTEILTLHGMSKMDFEPDFRNPQMLSFPNMYNTMGSLLLRGKVNISQLQGEIEFNTFLCDKPYN